MASNWNIDETFYPGPVIETITLFLDKEINEYTIEHIDGFTRFTGTVAGLPSIYATDGMSIINRWVNVINDGILIYEGYLNGIEYESTFLGGRTQINITVSSKLVD